MFLYKSLVLFYTICVILLRTYYQQPPGALFVVFIQVTSDPANPPFLLNR